MDGERTRLDPFNRLFQLLHIPRDDSDVGSLFGESFGQSKSQAGRSSSNIAVLQYHIEYRYYGVR